MRKDLTIHGLEINEQTKVKVFASKKFSDDRLLVKLNERYEFFSDSGQKWVDFFWPCSPNGYNNPVANMFGQRVKGVKCFCLCGSYNQSLKDSFVIGTGRILDTTQSGEITFFANDCSWAYVNNFGSIDLCIKRLA